MKTAVLALALSAAAVLAGCAGRPELPAPTAENTRSWADLAPTTTVPAVPRMEPVASLSGLHTEVWATCDRGHRIYVLEDGNRAGIAAVTDPSCPEGGAR